MGVIFYDKENMSTEDNYNTNNTYTSCNCSTHYGKQTASSPATNSRTIPTTNCMKNHNNLNYIKSGISREIVGNCKEMRIEDNRHNLRIVGNNNRIRICFNVGDITIIGNNTRLKITTNHGHIKYTGNNGCISLGKNSKEQSVDYSGCNGVLKLQNSKKSIKVNDDADGDDDEFQKNIVMGNTNVHKILKSSKEPKQNNASLSNLPVNSETFKDNCTDYSNKFKRAKEATSSDKEAVFQGQQLPSINIVNNFSNIVIANSSNICISPSSHTQ